MRKTIRYLIMYFVLVQTQSCETVVNTNTTPQCIWSESYNVNLSNFNIDYPSLLSPLHEIQIPFNGYDTDLMTVLQRLGDGFWPGGHQANLKVSMISDGVNCIGVKTETYYGGDIRITGNSILVNIPSDGFFGEVKVSLSSDDYNAQYSNDYLYYYVLWEEVSNDPNIVSFNTTGIRKNYGLDSQGRGYIVVDNSDPNALIFVGGNRQPLN